MINPRGSSLTCDVDRHQLGPPERPHHTQTEQGPVAIILQTDASDRANHIAQDIAVGGSLLGGPLAAFGIADTAHDLLKRRSASLCRGRFNPLLTAEEIMAMQRTYLEPVAGCSQRLPGSLTASRAAVGMRATPM